MFIKTARHDQRGTANSSILISWDLGMGMVILLGGVIAENIGFGAAFYTVAAMQLAGTLLFICATSKFFERKRLTKIKSFDDRKAALRRFLVERGNVVARTLHDLDHPVEVDIVTSV